ncbi:MAG: aminodeoxychorismate synthase, component I, partial [Betaproteobacteria bacterium TMED156]
MSSKNATILLDDFLSNSASPTSRVYENPEQKIVAYSTSEVTKAIGEIENSLKSGFYVIVIFSYELGKFFNGLKINQTKAPLLVAWSFRDVKKFSKPCVDNWLNDQKKQECKDSMFTHQSSGICNIKLNSSEGEYANKIKEIQKKITSGETYQVNYTFNISADFYGSSLDLYMRLRERQPSRFGAFIKDENKTILSFSPEWFVDLDGKVLRAKPMKGTLPISGSNPSDLSQDKKNRAENLMIVDLLRNDLGRVSQTGTVKVPKLFEVERVGEIFQMTSTIESLIGDEVSLCDFLKATFPCGSITGAPKQRTMQIIDELENDDRGLYCGSIGWFDPPTLPRRNYGNFMMSVCIRTATILNNQLTFGVGSGITIDSKDRDEWKECLLKASFLIRLPSGVGLFETIKIEKNKPRFFKLHINRLSRSAESFGISCDRDELEELVEKKIKNECKIKEFSYKLKIVLSPNGLFTLTIRKLSKIIDYPQIFWAAHLLGNEFGTINSKDPLFFHKTTERKIYDLVWRKAEKLGG